MYDRLYEYQHPGPTLGYTYTSTSNIGYNPLLICWWLVHPNIISLHLFRYLMLIRLKFDYKLVLLLSIIILRIGIGFFVLLAHIVRGCLLHVDSLVYINSNSWCPTKSQHGVVFGGNTPLAPVGSPLEQRMLFGISVKVYFKCQKIGIEIPMLFKVLYWAHGRYSKWWTIFPTKSLYSWDLLTCNPQMVFISKT